MFEGCFFYINLNTANKNTFFVWQNINLVYITRKIHFMTTLINQKHFSKVLTGMTVLLMSFIFSCNDPASKEEQTDTVIPADTMMKMNIDTIKTDTSKKGGQPTPVTEN